MYTLVKMKFGSHVYGTATEKSDTDYKGIYIPKAVDLVYGNPVDTLTSHSKKDKTQKNCADDVDIELYSLKKYMKLLLEGQTVAMDMFFTPQEFYEVDTPIWQDIQALRPDWLHSSIKPFVGYCMRQASKYGVKGSRVAAVRKAMDFFQDYVADIDHRLKLHEIWLELETHFKNTEHCSFITETMRGNPSATVRMFECCDRKVQEHITVKQAYEIYKKVFDEYGVRAIQAETNENVDWKAMSHAVRIADQAIELLKTEKIIFPRYNAEYLLNIKKGMLQYKQVAEHLEDLLIDLQTAQAETLLPEQPNHRLAQQVVTANYAAYILTTIQPGFNDYEKVLAFVNDASSTGSM